MWVGFDVSCHGFVWHHFRYVFNWEKGFRGYLWKFLVIILVNINPAYQATELKYALNKVDCKVLVTQKLFKKSNYIDILDSIAPEIKN